MSNGTSTIATGRVKKNLLEAASVSKNGNNVNSSFHGAVVVKGGKIIGSGFNNERTRIKKGDLSSCHAETSAIMDAISNMRRSTRSYSKIHGEQRHCLKRN